MTDTKPDAEKALREAHEACPCRWEADTAFGRRSVNRILACKWSGHAAINRAVRAAWEAGFANGMQTSAHALDNTPPPDDPDWLPKEGE